jgi:NADH-quinone oxidoreductase subunit J
MLLAAAVLAVLVDAMHGAQAAAGAGTVSPKQVGMALFGPYLLAVELASLLLLGALVVAWHLGRDDQR